MLARSESKQIWCTAVLVDQVDARGQDILPRVVTYQALIGISDTDNQSNGSLTLAMVQLSSAASAMSQFSTGVARIMSVLSMVFCSSVMTVLREERTILSALI